MPGLLVQVQRHIAPATLSAQLGGAATLATVRGSGVAAGLAHIYKEGGVQGFFRGNGINVLKVRAPVLLAGRHGFPKLSILLEFVGLLSSYASRWLLHCL